MPNLVVAGGTPTKKKTPYPTDTVAAALGGGPSPDARDNPGTESYPNQGVVTSSTTGGTTPAAAPAAAPPSGNPWDTDPGYLAALAAEQSGSQQADAALRAAQEAAIVGYGDPSIAAALGLTVSGNTAAAARANYLAGNSTLARLDRTHGLNQQASINNLAAHGILFSGETGYQRGQIDQNYGNNVYDAQQALLSGLNAAQAQDLATKQGLRGQSITALENAYTTAINDPNATSSTTTPAAAPTSATTPPAATAPSLAGQLAPNTNSNIGPGSGYTAPIGTSRLARKPLVNPYTTGQKRFG
jgi:hypothetical protein